MNWIKQHPLATYFILAYIITWVLVFPLVASAIGLIPVLFPPAWHAIGAIGPITAAFLIAGLTRGKLGIKTILGGLFRWRVGISQFLITVLSPFALLLGAAVILVFLGSTWPDFSLLVSVGFADISWVVNSLLPSIVYGLGEEPGWRGFALPRLQKNRSALFATAILYVFWGFWHLPFFFYRYNMTPIAILLFAISLFFGTIWLTFLFNSTGGSILMVIIWHMLWNFVDMITSIVSFALVPFMYLIFWTMVIIIVIIWKPGKLSTRNKHTGDSELEGDDGDSLERKRRENI